MTKKTSILTLVLALVAGSLGWAQSTDPVIWTFGGIYTTLPGYTGPHNPAYIGGTNTSGIPMANQVAYATSKIGFVGVASPVWNNQVIIGHSQGGLRALAVAKDMVTQAKALKATDPTRPGPETYLKGIITINSPVQGFSPLAQGVASLKNTMTTHVATVSDGIGSLNEAFGTDLISLVGTYANMDASAIADTKAMLNDKSFMVNQAMARLLAPGVESESSPALNSALDMGRASPWYSSTIARSGWYEYRITGYNTVVIRPALYVNYPFGGAPVLIFPAVTAQVPVTVAIYHPGEGFIPPEVKIGYIYGDNHDFNKVAASIMTSTGTPKEKESDNAMRISWARCGVSLAGDVAAVAHNLTAVGLDVRDYWEEFWDCASFWDDTYHGDLHNQAVHKRDQAAKAYALATFSGNLDQVVASALGSADNDGFIPVPDQFDDKIGSTDKSVTLGGNPINPLKLKIHASTTHFTALYSPEVWGSEGLGVVGLETGNNRGKVGASGAVRTYMDGLGLAKSVDTVRGDWDIPPSVVQ